MVSPAQSHEEHQARIVWSTLRPELVAAAAQEGIVNRKSPTQLSLDFLHKLGYVCQIVEKRLPIPGRFVTQDCFGIADILAYHAGLQKIVLLQTTSWANFATRKAKIQRSPHREAWKRAGGHIWLHGWGEKGLREEEL